MLSFQEFSVLKSCLESGPATQRQLVEQTGISLGAVNAALKELRNRELINSEGAITPSGKRALEPYKVDNAIIMAAGLSSRFAPLSFEKPKGVLKVKGEVLIERQIRQLQEAGITDITIVVGYKKEEFFYLADIDGVSIVINPDYSKRNNNSTIKRVEHLLGNTYICSSDDYFTENPFERYVYGSYYAAVYEDGPTPEYCLETKGKEKRIVKVTVGGQNAWTMMGHAYWDRTFSKEFCRILNDIYDQSDTAGKLWEDIYSDHVAQLPMSMRQYAQGIIWEFDSLDELRAFDPAFIDNVDSEIMDNICRVLACKREDIGGIVPIKQGLTNLSCSFTVDGASYVYRHPGEGTDAIINRATEAQNQQIAAKLGIDDTFIYEDPDAGWKISRYLDGCTCLDYGNWDQVAQAVNMVRKLHDSGETCAHESDIFEGAMEIVNMLKGGGRTAFKDFGELLELASGLNADVARYAAKTCLCHNDFYDPNILFKDGRAYLIDWEYSGMSDFASDLGTFICCAKDYGRAEAQRVIELYFGCTPTDEELFHCVGYVAISSFYWFVWALYKEDCGENVGEYLYLWYANVKKYGAWARELRERALR